MKRHLITVSGCVQGVGFRPFIFRLAKQYELVGSIRNTSMGVDIDVQGSILSLQAFQKDVLTLHPERAIIADFQVAEAPLHAAFSFDIATSECLSDTTLALLPDTAMCDHCRKEFSDPTNRRYRYPFTHCMTCGPRFSLFVRMPFDRSNTTMTDFSMCDECQSEYDTPSDRRFYSQTNCCPRCGPELSLFDTKKRLVATKHEAVHEASEAIRKGQIVAVKNTGGYLLLVDATNEHAVQKLRVAKQRPKKPFALLMPDLSYARQTVSIPHIAEEVLLSPAAPIVLLQKRPEFRDVAPSVAPESPYLGIMLPHNALQYLILEKFQHPLVATSGNVSGNPLCITEEESFIQLADVADLFLVHNRRIVHRLDDSVVHIISDRPMLIRRARGYIPYAVPIPETYARTSDNILAVGGHLKNSFALAKKKQLYVSQHIGDLDSCELCRVYEGEIASFEELLSMKPEKFFGDTHPGYYTSQYMQKRTSPSEHIQHHKAHVFSGILDSQLKLPCISFSWDGTGWGDDQTIWGGESFIVDETHMRRFASVYPFRLPGSEKAVREPRRTVFGLLYAMFGDNIPSIYLPWLEKSFTQEERVIIHTALKKEINSPLCSSMGRLFDAVSALLGCVTMSQFEGHPACALETVAYQAEKQKPRYTLSLIQEKGLWLLDWRDLIQEIFQDIVQGVPLCDIALGFHLAIAQGVVQIAQKSAIENVLLTGGVMQNKLLVEAIIHQLKKAGLMPFWYSHIPPNDGGLAVGQIMGGLFNQKGRIQCV